jgi:hypothetical protein
MLVLVRLHACDWFGMDFYADGLSDGRGGRCIPRRARGAEFVGMAACGKVCDGVIVVWERRWDVVCVRWDLLCIGGGSEFQSYAWPAC